MPQQHDSILADFDTEDDFAANTGVCKRTVGRYRTDGLNGAVASLLAPETKLEPGS